MPNNRTGKDYLDGAKKTAKKAVKNSLAYKVAVKNPLTQTLVVASKSIAKGVKGAVDDKKAAAQKKKDAAQKKANEWARKNKNQNFKAVQPKTTPPKTRRLVPTLQQPTKTRRLRSANKKK